MMQAGYIEVAAIIAKIESDVMRKFVANLFAKSFGDARSKFKRHLFMKACNVDDA